MFDLKIAAFAHTLLPFRMPLPSSRRWSVCGERAFTRSLRALIFALLFPAMIALPVRQGFAGQQSGQQQQGGRSQQGQGIGGPQQSAQPARPAQNKQTSNQTEVTPSSQNRPAQPPQPQPPQSQPSQTQPPQPTPQRGTGTPGEPSGTTTPRAPVGQGLQLPNTQIPATGAARTVEQTPATLSLADAIRIAVDNNLSTLFASTRVEEAQSISRQQRAALLPNLFGTAFQQNRTLNLRAQGLSSNSGQMMSGMAGGSGFMIPSFVGPFNTFDARVYFAQSIFSLAAIRSYRSSKTGVRIARLGEELAREQVATFVTLFYMNVLRADRDIEAARADLTLAESLLKLASEQHNAGVATGIDVVRAETRVSQERVRLIEAETSDSQARLDLQRVVGLPQGGALTLSEPLRFVEDLLPTLEATVTAAIAARPEVQIAEETVRQREQERKARVADQYPSLEAYADYGDSGVTLSSNDRPTRTYGVRLNVPIFDGGLTRGRIDQAEIQSRQAELQLGSTRGQVEEEVRLALVSLRTAAEQVRASDDQFRLATREFDLARMRFESGIADNTEVVSAQAALANARSLQVQALVQYNAARLNFAAAAGRAREFKF